MSATPTNRIETRQSPFQTLCPVMVTATAALTTAIASVATTRPETAYTGTGVSMQPTGGKVYWYPDGADNNFQLRFHMTDAADETASVAVFGVVRTRGQIFAAGYTHPVSLEQFDHHYMGLLAIIAGAAVGIAGGPIDATHYFADTITISTDETLSPQMRVVHDVADGIAAVVGDLTGYEGLCLVFDVGTAASVNASGRTF